MGLLILRRLFSWLAALFVMAGTNPIWGNVRTQEPGSVSAGGVVQTKLSEPLVPPNEASSTPPIWMTTLDPIKGETCEALVAKALTNNGELAVWRLHLDRAQAQLRQAGARPNPSLSVSQSTGQLTGTVGDRSTTIGFSLPLELGGKRSRRLDVAERNLRVTEAEIADRERRLAAEVRLAVVEVLAAGRELSFGTNVQQLDRQTLQLVQARVNEGDLAPLEVNLLKVEAERLQARRLLAENKFQGALAHLKLLVGMAPEEPLTLRENLAVPLVPDPPPGLEPALADILERRADVRLARLTEEAAQAGIRLAAAQAVPDVTLQTTYNSSRSITDLPVPLAAIPDLSRTLSFGVSVTLPFFNRNQGNRAEAEIILKQARQHREQVEKLARYEIVTALARFRAAHNAFRTLNEGAVTRSMHNLHAMQAAYSLGAYRMTELIAEQRRWLDVQRELTEALAEQNRALIVFHQASGFVTLTK